MKKIISILSLILLFLASYLLLTHHFIYRGIGMGNLPEVEKEHNYMISGNKINEDKIVYSAIGDSLTAGVGTSRYEDSFPYLVAQDLGKKEMDVNLQVFAYPGARTNDLIRDLLDPALASHPDVVTVLIGTNDMHGFISLNEFKLNYENILDKLTKETEAKIYLVSVPFIGADTLILPPWRQYFNTETIKFNKIIKDLAGSYRVEYIDIATPTAANFRKSGKYYSADSFHPSAEGYTLWSKIIYDKINQ